MEKLLMRIPFYQQFAKKRLETDSAFYINNRIQVLDCYRYLIKAIPRIYPRPLQQTQKINELRWIFKNSKQLPNIYETEGRTRLAQQLVTEIKEGDHTRLADFVPNYHPMMFTDLEMFLQKNLPKKRRWWRGHIL